MTSLNRHENVTPFMEFSVNGKKQPKNLSYRILVIISFGLLRSSYFIFLGSFQIVLFLTNFFQMPSLYRHEKLTLFVKFSANGKKKLKNLPYKFFVIISFALLQSIYFNFLHSFQIILFLTILTQMPSLKWYQKVTPFMELSVNVKNNWKKNPTSFSSLFQLQSYGQITSISYVHFRSFCF